MKVWLTNAFFTSTSMKSIVRSERQGMGGVSSWHHPLWVPWRRIPFVMRPFNYPVGFFTGYLVFPIRLFAHLHMPQHQYQWASLVPKILLLLQIFPNFCTEMSLLFGHFPSSSAWQCLTTQQLKPVRGGFAVAAVQMSKEWYKSTNNTDMSHKAQSEIQPEYAGCCCDLELIRNAVRVNVLSDLVVCGSIMHPFYFHLTFRQNAKSSKVFWSLKRPCSLTTK